MQQLRWIYLLLIIIRIAFAFSPGYIHPDEWFQFGEILAGDLFGIDILRTWEFDPIFPCRSMASIRLFGLPFYLLGKEPSTYALFVMSRAIFLFLSFILDWSTWQLLPRQTKWKGMVLLASSGSMMAFSVRSFSNNIEATLLAVSLICLLKLQENCNIRTSSVVLGMVIGIGVFSRFTFVIFAAPLGFAYLQLIWRNHHTMKASSTALLSLITGASLTAGAHIVYDSFYYSNSPRSIVVAPLNAAIYNFKNENLALHGTHPRWLHAVINAPIILGLVPWTCLAFDKIRWKALLSQTGRAAMRRVLQQTIFFSIACLSLQPHQEPRFLLPLVMPMTILLAASRYSENRILLYLSALQSAGIAIFFGFLHQAGTIPAMLASSSHLSSSNISTEIFFWRSFMPPRHLLIPASSPKEIMVTDCQSMAVEEIINKIRSSGQSNLLLFAPSWVLHDVNRGALSRAKLELTPMTQKFPHIDTDHIGESIARYQETRSFIESFSFRAYSVGLSRSYLYN